MNHACIATGDLSELALQTEQFSKKLGKMAPVSTCNPVGGSTSGLADVTEAGSGASYSGIVNEDVATTTSVTGGSVKASINITSTTDTVCNLGQTFAFPRPTASNAVTPRVSLMSNELKHPGQ